MPTDKRKTNFRKYLFLKYKINSRGIRNNDMALIAITKEVKGYLVM